MGVAATLFAFMNFFARLSGEYTHWTVVAAVRAFIGAIVAMGIARARGVSPIVRGSRVMWSRSLLGTAAMACSFFAVTSKVLPLADSVTLNNTTPIFLAILSPYILHERSGHRVTLAVALSMTGVVLIAHPTLLFGELRRVAYVADPSRDLVTYRAALVPCMVALVGAFLSALAMLSLRIASAGESPEAVAAHYSVVAFVVHAALAVRLADLPSLRAVPFMVLAGVTAGAAQVAMTRSYRLERAARVSGIGYLQVVVGASLGALVLREPLSLSAVCGIGLVMAGGGLLTLLGILDVRKAAPAAPSDGYD